MEDPAIASRIIGMLIGEEILDIEFVAQEYIHQDAIWPLALFRMDFVATIRTDQRTKKVLIEVQKAKRETDIIRFRNYVGKQYSNRENELPIITIYFLGYNLPDLPEVVVKVHRSLVGVISGRVYEVQNEFVEKLTHEAYLIQVNHLKRTLRTPIERMLSIFDQSRKLTEEYFLEYPDTEIPEEALPLAKRLQLITRDQSLREQLELEELAEFEYHQTIGARERKIVLLEQQKQQTEEALQKVEEEKRKAEEEKRKAEEEKRKAEERVGFVLKQTVKALQQAGKNPTEIAQLLGRSPEEIEQILSTK